MKNSRFLAVVAIALLLAGCGEQTRPAPGEVGGAVTVFAAASLKEPFEKLGDTFAAAHPGSTVRFSFAGSSALAMQINQGAPADLFASAATANMKTVTDAGNADGTPVVFVRNQLVIAVPRGNPQRITGLADLARPGLKVALCAEQVPCGAAAKKALAAGKVTLTPVTLEQDVKQALSKVSLGEADAALVYRTDTEAPTAAVEGVDFPESAQAVNDYPIVLLKGAPNKTTAVAFLSYVLSSEGLAVLTEAGFQRP